jgi:hypothetical protein
MKRKTISFLVLWLAVGSLMAQSGKNQSNRPSTAHSKHSNGDVTVQGCLGRATGDYILTQTDPGNTFKLEKVTHGLKLGPHLGEQVVVTGWKSPTLSTSSDALNRAGPPSSVTLMVASIRTVAKECTPREVSGGAVSAREAEVEVEVEVSSTPDDAEIEVDGNFVGNTVSTIGIGPGQHKLVVKKNGYKPWEKTLTVTKGRVRVHAELKAESK